MPAAVNSGKKNVKKQTKKVKAKYDHSSWVVRTHNMFVRWQQQLSGEGERLSKPLQLTGLQVE